MARTRKYTSNSTEAFIDGEMEFYRELEKANKAMDESSAEGEANGPETKNGVIVNALNVNVRKEPSLETNNVIEILRQGDKVKILDKVGDFYKVSTSTNSVAYIFSSYIKEE